MFCNPGNSIFELYKGLAQARFATNRTKLDIQCSHCGTRVAKTVTKRFWTGDLRKN